jgi:tricorn protease-like protein
MGYEHTNSKGNKYYLHSRGKLFFFSKKEEDSIDLPEGYTVVENNTTGLPMLKKKI